MTSFLAKEISLIVYKIEKFSNRESVRSCCLHGNEPLWPNAQWFPMKCLLNLMFFIFLVGCCISIVCPDQTNIYTHTSIRTLVFVRFLYWWDNFLFWEKLFHSSLVTTKCDYKKRKTNFHLLSESSMKSECFAGNWHTNALVTTLAF